MINKTFRLFISSTFSDFQAERSLLNGKIFDEIDTFCRSQGFSFQIVDLRWGVNTESVLDQKTVPICLKEVVRCEQLAPKPNFLVMVGERYGNWMPVPYRIECSLFNEIISTADQAGQALLSEWYFLDENALGGEYILRRREGDYRIDDNWVPVQDALHTVFAQAVHLCSLSDDKAAQLIGSATEQEIYEGLLRHDKSSDNVIAVFRNGYPDKDHDPEKVFSLRQRIRERMERDGHADGIIELEYDDGRAYLAAFEDYLLRTLKGMISEEIARLQGISRENDVQANAGILSQLSEDFFCGRDKELSMLAEYTNGSSNRPFLLFGESGSGKTSLLAKYVSELSCPAFFSFFGTEDTAYSLKDAVRALCLQARARFSLESHFFATDDNLSEILWDTMLALDGKENCVFVLDGLESFFDLDSVSKPLFPGKLPPNIKLIVSTADISLIENLFSGDREALHLQPLDEVDCRTTFHSTEERFGRRFVNPGQNQYIDQALANAKSPLHVKLLADLCVNWRSIDPGFSLPETAEDAVLSIFSSMYQENGHGRELTLYSLALILAAPTGIEEDDLLRLLISIPSVKEELKKESFYRFDKTKLPFVLWSRLFFDLENLLCTSISHGMIVIKPLHRIVKAAFLLHFEAYYKEAQQILLDYYEGIETFVSGNHKAPNLKKCLSLLPMLIDRKQWQRLYIALSDLDYADAMCKSGAAEDLLFAYQVCDQHLHGKAPSKQYLQLSACLRDKHIMLSFYSDELLACLASSGADVRWTPVIEMSHLAESDAPVVEFKYNRSSCLAWRDDGHVLVIGYSRHLRFFFEDSSNEKFHIFIETDGENASIIQNVLWLSRDLLAVVMSNQQLRIYSVSAQRTSHRFSIYSVNAEKGVLFFEQYSSLVYCSENAIKAVDANTGSRGLWDKQFRDLNSIAKKENSILVNLSDGTAIRYASLDPAHGNRVGKKQSIFWSNDGFESSLFPTDGDDYILVTNDLSDSRFVAALLYGAKDNKHRRTRFLFPPEYLSVRWFLVGAKTLVFVYGNRIIWLDYQTLHMRQYVVGNINRAVWKRIDSEICVLANGRLFSLVLNHASGDDLGTCFSSKKSIISTSYRLSFISAERIWSKIRPANHLEYSGWFSEIGLYPSNDRFISREATLISHAGNGSLAVAYEMMDSISVFDPQGRLLLVLDKLHMGICDSILKMEFSQDSMYLLIWRNQWLTVVNLQSKDKVLDINIKWRPLLFANFSEDSQSLFLTFSDKQERTIHLQNATTRALPKKTVDKQLHRFCTPYSANPFREKKPTFCLVFYDDFSGAIPPSKWFTHNRNYYGQSSYLAFNEGEFYLNGSRSQKFNSRGYHFIPCLSYVRSLNRSEFESFLSEKNDLSSGLVEVPGGRFLILVSKLLSSVVVFDTEQMEVLAVYLHPSKIIGWSVLSTDTSMSIRLQGNSEVAETNLAFHFPHEAIDS